MTTKRGTYRFTYNGSDFGGFLDKALTSACKKDLSGYIIGNEGHGMIVAEGKPANVDAFANEIDTDQNTSDFLTLKQEQDITASYSKFSEFKESGACDSC